MRELRIPTSAEVYRAIRDRHPEIISLGGFSDPDGTSPVAPVGQGRMDTTWGFPGTGLPILETMISWDVNYSDRTLRDNEKAEYWLIVYREADDAPAD